MSEHNQFTVANFKDDLERGRFPEAALRAIHGNSDTRSALLYALKDATDGQIDGLEKALAFLIDGDRRAQWHNTPRAQREALINSWGFLK